MTLYVYVLNLSVILMREELTAVLVQLVLYKVKRKPFATKTFAISVPCETCAVSFMNPFIAVVSSPMFCQWLWASC